MRYCIQTINDPVYFANYMRDTTRATLSRLVSPWLLNSERRVVCK